MLQQRRQSDEMVMKSCLLGYIKDPYREKLREAFRNDGDSCSSYVRNASFGTDAFGEGEIFNTTFVSQLMFGTWETSRRNETVHALRKHYANSRFYGAQYRGDADTYEYRAIRCLTNVRKNRIVYLDCFMICAVLALYPGLFREGICAIIDGMKNDRQHEQEIEFIDKGTSCCRKNRASVIRATIQKHPSVLGLVNPRGELSDMRKNEERCYPLFSPTSCFWTNFERMAEMELSMEKMKSWRDDIQSLLRLRFIGVRLCEFKSHFVNIYSIVLYNFMKEICPELDVSNKEIISEDRDTYWQNIFDSKRPKPGKKRYSLGQSITMEYTYVYTISG